MSDTIAAIATGNVLSAIGILRLSGDGTLAVIDRVFHPANGRPMSEAPNRQLVYGAFCDTDFWMKPYEYILLKIVTR